MKLAQLSLPTLRSTNAVLEIRMLYIHRSLQQLLLYSLRNHTSATVNALFWCHSFISPLGQQTLSSWERAHTHTLHIMLTLSPSSPFLPSVVLQKELHLRSILVYVREKQKWASIPHLHNDLCKKLLTASGLHAWGTFLKTYCVYQGFLYIECQKYYILYRMHYVISNILFVYNQ